MANKKPVLWSVFVNNQPKGEAFKVCRWVWLRPNGGKETYGPKDTIEDVRTHVARVCNVWSNAVEFRRSERQL